ncbi:uncharacterized protein [Glycine max]|uniref:uncharacterized protein n=1 Tax=Glycine max TaxID=3847 RepID=UPI0003DE9E8D|nr:uncharacterized protein LOC102669518 [Glycine max]|eukprot:XP_006598394.1 uncharacterized protein LOC102669518 [Glycine max]
MTLKSLKAIWDYLKDEYAGDDRIRSMQVLNLRREFELQRMKESEIIKEYSNKLLGIANKIKLLGSDFADSRIVKKTLVTVPERYEASIASLENTKDLSKITLAEVLHALQAQEQRRLMRQDRVVEGVLPAKHHEVDESKKRFFSRRINQQAAKIVQTTKTKVRIKRKIIHLVSIVTKKVMHLSDVGGDQMQNVTSATR